MTIKEISQTEFEAKIAVAAETDWARLAACIDSRWGSVGTTGNTERVPFVGVVHKDPRLICWLRDVFGGTTSTDSADELSWSHTGERAVDIIRHIIQFMLIKGGQAETVLAYHELGNSKLEDQT
jgi:hypothetical protein